MYRRVALAVALAIGLPVAVVGLSAAPADAHQLKKVGSYEAPTHTVPGAGLRPTLVHCARADPLPAPGADISRRSGARPRSLAADGRSHRAVHLHEPPTR